MNLLKLSLNVPTKHWFEKCNEKIGHCAHKRDVMDQSYPIYACTCADHMCYSNPDLNIIVKQQATHYWPNVKIVSEIFKINTLLIYYPFS